MRGIPYLWFFVSLWQFMLYGFNKRIMRKKGLFNENNENYGW